MFACHRPRSVQRDLGDERVHTQRHRLGGVGLLRHRQDPVHVEDDSLRVTAEGGHGQYPPTDQIAGRTRPGRLYPADDFHPWHGARTGNAPVLASAEHHIDIACADHVGLDEYLAGPGCRLWHVDQAKRPGRLHDRCSHGGHLSIRSDPYRNDTAGVGIC